MKKLHKSSILFTIIILLLIIIIGVLSGFIFYYNFYKNSGTINSRPFVSSDILFQENENKQFPNSNTLVDYYNNGVKELTISAMYGKLDQSSGKDDSLYWQHYNKTSSKEELVSYDYSKIDNTTSNYKFSKFMYDQIHAYTKLGGKVMISLSSTWNWTGDHSEEMMPPIWMVPNITSAEIKTSVENMLNFYHITGVDYDLEGPGVLDSAGKFETSEITLLATASQTLFDEWKKVNKIFKLQVTLYTFDSSEARAIVILFQENYKEIPVINPMAMSLGTQDKTLPFKAYPQSYYIKNSLDLGLSFLSELYNLDKDKMAKYYSATPMIGYNDGYLTTDKKEHSVLTLAGWKSVIDYAIKLHMLQICNWAITRDHSTPTDKIGQVGGLYSGVKQTDLEFVKTSINERFYWNVLSW